MFESFMKMFAEVAGAALDVITATGILVGGWWTYRRFIRQREDHPRIDLTVDVEFVGAQGSDWLITLVAHVANTGAVRHYIKDLQFKVQGIASGAPLALRSDDRVEFVPIMRGQWFPSDWQHSFVDAGVTNTYRFPTKIPASYSFVKLWGKFDYRDERESFHTSERVFRVPSAEQGLPS